MLDSCLYKLLHPFIGQHTLVLLIVEGSFYDFSIFSRPISQTPFYDIFCYFSGIFSILR